MNRIRFCFDKGFKDANHPFWPLSCPFHKEEERKAWRRGVDQAFSEKALDMKKAEEAAT